MIKKRIEDKANELLKSLEINELPIPIDRIADLLNVQVLSYDLGEGVSGVLVVNNNVGTIGLNPNHSNVRKRFTIAHELGHFLLHNKTKDSLFVDKEYKVHFRNHASSSGEIKNEQEANAFAAALLMPKDMLVEIIDNYIIDIEDESTINNLADIFGVSPMAMTYRLINLNLR